jgi:hypothetical protein
MMKTPQGLTNGAVREVQIYSVDDDEHWHVCQIEIGVDQY